MDVAGNVIALSLSPVKAVEIFSGDSFGQTLRRFKICRQHRSAACDCAPRFVAAPPSVPQKLELFVTDVTKDFVRVFDYDGNLIRRVSLDDPRTGLALAVSGICFVPKEEEKKRKNDDDDDNNDDDNENKKSKPIAIIFLEKQTRFGSRRSL